MDKLQWFKFTPSDWMMGKIQRCPEITQARFIRLCCLYWNKDCVLSIEDAEIEIDKEHFEILVAKKIVSLNDTHFNISFLDEQYLEIQEDTKDKSKSGIIGNLKRWHPLIYNEFVSKKISLEQAIKKSKSIAKQSHPDNTPIAEQSQNIADKTRQDEDKKRKEEILKSKNWLESVAMKLRLSNSENMLNTFLNEQEILVGEGNGLNRNIEDIKNHFVKWAKVNNEKQKPTKTNYVI